MAFGVFIMIKLINKISSIGKKPEEPKAPVITKDQELLTEIRDLLKDKKSKK